MNILVIGNGFDLAHEVPTKYVDFLAFLDVLVSINNQRVYSVDKIENKIIKKTLSRFKGRRNNAPLFEMVFCNICDYVQDNGTCGKVSAGRCHFLLNSIEDNKILQNNKWINYLLKIYKSIPGNNWIDIESEIKNVMQFIEEMKEMDDKDAKRKILSLSTAIEDLIHVGNNYQADFDTKKEYVKNLEIDLKNLTLCLDQYMYFVTQNIPLKKYSLDVKNLPVDKILSFNYTSIYKKIYEHDLPVECCYIHGQAGKKNLVLGFQEYLKGDKKDNQLLCVHFKKFFQRIYNGTGCEYKKWLSSDGNHRVYFFGHSLDITDGDIIKDIIMNEHVEKVTIYYHDEDAHARQIMNLIGIITQDELINRTFSENPKIVFEKQEWMSELKNKG